MLRPNAWRVACLVGLLASCEGSPPAPRLAAVVPARAFSDRPIRVQLLGQDFLPAYQIDLHTGSRTGEASGFSGQVVGDGVVAPLSDFSWRGTDQLTATLAPGLPAGTHPVVLQDPRGARTELPAGFQSLGPDRQGPVISELPPAPDRTTAPGARLRLHISIDDPSGVTAARWEVRNPVGVPLTGRCPVDPAGATTSMCGIELVVPEQLPGQPLEIFVEATDQAHPVNVGNLIRTFAVGPRPTLLSVTPARGGTAGGTEVVVRGTGFRPGSRVYFGRTLLQPGGGIRLDDQTISGRTPAHPEGGARVWVETPLGDARLSTAQTLFEFDPPPVLRALDPAVAPSTGGTALRAIGEHFTAQTRLLAGPSLRAAVPLADQVVLSATEIRATTLPGPGQTRTTVFAVDPDNGWTALADGLTFTGAAPP